MDRKLLILLVVILIVVIYIGYKYLYLGESILSECSSNSDCHPVDYITGKSYYCDDTKKKCVATLILRHNPDKNTFILSTCSYNCKTDAECVGKQPVTKCSKEQIALDALFPHVVGSVGHCYETNVTGTIPFYNYKASSSKGDVYAVGTDASPPDYGLQWTKVNTVGYLPSPSSNMDSKWMPLHRYLIPQPDGSLWISAAEASGAMDKGYTVSPPLGWLWRG